MTTEQYIIKAKKIHNDRYNYDKTVYVNAKTKLIVTCPIHGDFLILPNNHTSHKQGCKKCGISQMKQKLFMSEEEFIRRAHEIHNHQYIYDDKLNYTGTRNTILYKCPVHGYIEQNALSHLQGNGCQKCLNRILYFEDFEAKAREIHGDKFTYHKDTYKGYHALTTITCPIHGDFEQLVSVHIRTTNPGGCQLCANENRSNDMRLTTKEFITKAKEVHKKSLNQYGRLKYHYHKVDYVDNKIPVWIHCDYEDENGFVHGDFLQTPQAHLRGKGCPICAKKFSKPELEICEFLDFYDIKYIQHDKKILPNNAEIDIYIPDKKLAIEFNGTYWHSEAEKYDKYHYHKSLECEKLGIHLIHVWEHLWSEDTKKQVYKNIIKSYLGLNKTIFARKCTKELVDLSNCDKELKKNIIDFFDKNNINGYRYRAKYCTLLRYNNEIVHAFTWGKPFTNKNIEWELIRGASKQGYNVIGGSSKLWKFFISELNPNSIVYYIDYNFFDGNSIQKLNPTPIYKSHSLSFWNYNTKTGEVTNRNPMNNSEIKDNPNIIKIVNAGTKTFIWEK